MRWRGFLQAEYQGLATFSGLMNGSNFSPLKSQLPVPARLHVQRQHHGIIPKSTNQVQDSVSTT